MTREETGNYWFFFFWPNIQNYVCTFYNILTHRQLGCYWMCLLDICYKHFILKGLPSTCQYTAYMVDWHSCRYIYRIRVYTDTKSESHACQWHSGFTHLSIYIMPSYIFTYSLTCIIRYLPASEPRGYKLFPQNNKRLSGITFDS